MLELQMYKRIEDDNSPMLALTRNQKNIEEKIVVDVFFLLIQIANVTAIIFTGYPARSLRPRRKLTTLSPTERQHRSLKKNNFQFNMIQ